MDNSKYKTKITIVIITGVLLLSLVSFGYFYVSSNQSDKNRLAGGCFSTSFTDGESINLQNAFPQSFDEAKENKSYDFTITNTCNLPSKYYIILNVKEGSFNSDFIDYTLNTSNFEKLSNTLENTKYSFDEGYNKSFIIGSGLLNQNESITHNLKLWIDENVGQNDLTANSKFTAQIKIVNEVASQLGVDKIKNLVKDADTTSTDVIEAEEVSSTCTNTLAYDGTEDNNLRYVGANPCNYVSFNNELWRIIGVMNNVDDGTGKKETRLKIIKKENLAVRASWDSSPADINSGEGFNDWTQADLMQELNGDYLDTTLSANTMWYNSHSNSKTGEYDYTKSIKKNSQLLIGNANWYLGGPNANIITTNEIYIIERGNNAYSGQSTSWIGKVALIYPSDYGFAVGNTNNLRQICLNTNLNSMQGNNCLDNYLYFSNTWYYTLTHNSNYKSSVLTISNGNSSTALVHSSSNSSIYPALYLKSNVSIISGIGTEENPFVLD